MLRFDIKNINENVYRINALITLIISLIYLYGFYNFPENMIFKILPLILVIGGFVRGFINPHKCVSYLIFDKFLIKFNMVKSVNAGGKMFADKILFIASLLMVVGGLLNVSLVVIPSVALVIFSFIDLSIGFCVACWFYNFYYKFKIPQ